MKETELNKVLNYMKQYVEDKFEHDSEPMLNYKDIQLVLEEINRLNNIINELENRDDVLEEFEDFLERQKVRNSEWNNFIMVNGRLGIPVSYLLNKLKELKGSDKECN